jgi:saccharopine dehydrogenase-like NADP-dependent oxidoreductase
MRRVLVLGAGKIGRMIAHFLAGTGDYDVLVGDVDPIGLERLRQQTPIETVWVDATSPHSLAEALAGRQAVISALSFAHNPAVVEAALEAGASYFDLTEDIATAREVRRVAEQARPGQVFAPQCGLAPGFISIVARELARNFDSLDRVEMRVGALPQFPTNALKYNLTWSTDGLINEYCNPCETIHEGRRIDVLPLEGLEEFSLDGVHYEAFNTSGGLGTLCETFEGRVRELNYKTVRYLGHRDLMWFLAEELRLNQQRDVFKSILENALPITFQDVVVIFCTASGRRGRELVQISDARKIYNRTIGTENWSAIQITTAAGVCAVVDLHFAGQLPPSGFVRQEQIALDDFLANRFGRYYESQLATRFSRGVGASNEEIGKGN